MTYLLDTHILLWWFDDPSQLAQKAQMIIRDPHTLIFVSSVSTWEIVIKKALGKLRVSDRIFSLIAEENFTELSITVAHTQMLEKLPAHHNDPFDRLLIAQALCEKATLISRDGVFKKYTAPLVRG
ncbi:type II toxin-antitoxin system VapC family toxin [Candidatus Uhrbacteria bacterium]|nr:type II toxin-antitoxin system VapC family toxin [Candidatus Uhrbacteria bacterium]